jgi:hypothetical protein
MDEPSDRKTYLTRRNMMKDRVVFTGIISSLLIFMLVITGCGDKESGGGGTSNSTVNQAAITGITVPATGGTPVPTITETPQYTGTVIWAPQPAGTFAASTVYTATITLTAKAGYTFDGVTANFFTVSGASTSINAANSGTVTAEFPSTAAAAANFVSKNDESTSNDAATLGLVGTAASSNVQSVATAEIISNGKIKITSHSEGSATVTVSNAAGHEAKIQVTVAANGSITIGTITKYVSTNPLSGAWRQGALSNISELVIFTEDEIAYYAKLRKQTKAIDTTNKNIYLAVPGIDNDNEKSYIYKLNDEKRLVIIDSYFDGKDGSSEDFAFTRIEGSVKTGIDDIWYSQGRTGDDRLNTLLVIRADSTVYASFGMTGDISRWDVSKMKEWGRSSYKLSDVDVTRGTGIIRWLDSSNENYNYIREGDFLTILKMNDDPYQLQKNL